MNKRKELNGVKKQKEVYNKSELRAEQIKNKNLKLLQLILIKQTELYIKLTLSAKQI